MPADTPIAFFSYSREDSDFALRLAEDLRAAGAVVWIDQLDIEPGEDWDVAIEAAVTKSPRMLLILSPASVQSRNVRNEIAFAIDEKKTIIPVLYQDCMVPLQLRRVQQIDLRSDYQLGLKALVKTLAARERGPATAAAPATPQETPSTAVMIGDQARLEEQRKAAEQARLEQERKQVEQARLEEEQKQAAEQAQLEEERKQAAEQAGLEEELKQAAEQARLEEEQKQAAEQARLEEERRQAAEQARLEKEQKRATERARLEEERKQASEQARLEPEQGRAGEKARQEQKEPIRQAAAEKVRIQNEGHERLERIRERIASRATLVVLTSIVVLAGLGLVVPAIRQALLAYLRPAVPTIEFNAGKPTVNPGESTQLTWKAQNAERVSIYPDIGDVSTTGIKDVTPQASVTYTAVATGREGTVSKTVSVTVGALQPTIEFRVSPPTVRPGDTVHLTWNAENAQKVSIYPDIGDVSTTGSKDVTLQNPVTYTAVATGRGGTDSKTVSVSFWSAPPPSPPKLEFTASKTTVNSGEPVTLTWKPTGAVKVKIEPRLVHVNPFSGNKTTIRPQATVTYTAVATGPGGSTAKKVTITVLPPQRANPFLTAESAAPTQPPTLTFTAKIEQVLGLQIHLSWDAQNAQKVRIESDKAVKTLPQDFQTSHGDLRVDPPPPFGLSRFGYSITFTATATGPGGTAKKEVTVSLPRQ